MNAPMPPLAPQRMTPSPQPAVVDTARALVAIASVNPEYDPASTGEQQVAEWIHSWAEAHQIEVRMETVLPGRANVILTVRNGAERPHGLLVGHTDTVTTAGMVIPPYDPRIVDGRLFGRGSADMKGPLAAMLHSLLVLRSQLQKWRGTQSVACVVDEEYQARGIKALLRGNQEYDFAVVGEPSGMRVVRGCKGCLRFSFEAVGKAAHSSTPDSGRNAIVAMSEAILALDRYFRGDLAIAPQPGFGSNTGSVGLVQGGTGINIVPESCRASVDIRLLPGQSSAQVLATAQQHIRLSSVRVPGIEWRFGATFDDPAFETKPAVPLVAAALKLAAQNGADVVGYSCDASKIAEAGVPCIIFGPGDIACAHTADESIPLREVCDAVDYYASLVQALMPAS